MARPVLRDRYMCAMPREHPCARGRFTLATYLEYEHLVARCGGFDSAKLRPLPFKLPDITIFLAWHPQAAAGPRHRWLRARLLEAALS